VGGEEGGGRGEGWEGDGRKVEAGEEGGRGGGWEGRKVEAGGRVRGRGEGEGKGGRWMQGGGWEGR